MQKDRATSTAAGGPDIPADAALQHLGRTERHDPGGLGWRTDGLEAV